MGRAAFSVPRGERMPAILLHGFDSAAAAPGNASEKQGARRTSWQGPAPPAQAGGYGKQRCAATREGRRATRRSRAATGGDWRRVAQLQPCGYGHGGFWVPRTQVAQVGRRRATRPRRAATGSSDARVMRAGEEPRGEALDAAVKIPEFDGLDRSPRNRRLTNHDLRMSKVRIIDGPLSFYIRRLGILLVCSSSGRRRRRPSFFSSAEEEHFQTR